MSAGQAIISPRAADRLQAGHLWIYRSDVVACEANPGSVVSVRDKRGRVYGRAFYSSSSLITLRLITQEDRDVGKEFWRHRLQQARQLRQQVVRNSEVFRLVHSEGDAMPSVIVDCYGEVLSVQTLSQGAEQIKPILVELLLELFQPKAIVERNDSKVRALEGLPQTASILYGSDPGEIICRENGLPFYFQPLSGQKTGAFLDHRENRASAAGLARGKALDCFCYAGSFAIHLAEACEEVEAVDLSQAAVAMGQRNAALNGFGNVRFGAENVFDRLKLYDRLRKRFDTIVLDPPAFAKNRSHIEAALRGYREINLRALRLLNPGGLLVTASCSQLIDETLFLNLLTQTAADARRRVQVLQKRTQAQDHPFLLSMPETYYLKCLFLRVLD
ncbi:MAG: class I SAM-dependent rRNA methyltransferase [Acidobacteria bacterium]|nr:class I SAM-dependent rRNA methyltransferase [Acidobacteriota bacterium]MCI0621762.1 class I SAM-dependent rRNA methyltransferase [Acidobacteriota bacterium]MCI0718350.1 class I SAM-dependent rRNA methyltransferase [Acidobacteriota bacterium]